MDLGHTQIAHSYQPEFTVASGPVEKAMLGASQSWMVRHENLAAESYPMSMFF